MSRRRTSGPLLSFLVVLAASQAGFAQTSDRDRLVADITKLRATLDAKQSLLLSPSAADQKTYAASWGQKDRGLIRLMPRGKYETLLTVREGGAYYSFTRRTHEYGYATDVGLDQRTLSVGFAGADFGFMTDLGDVPLESIGLDHPSLRFLVAYATPTVEADARKEQRRAMEGFQVDGIRLKKSARAEVGTTYALRSVNYRETDVLVAFRVLREDTEGSLIIAWKMLKEFAKPDLVRDAQAER